MTVEDTRWAIEHERGVIAALHDVVAEALDRAISGVDSVICYNRETVPLLGLLKAHAEEAVAALAAADALLLLPTWEAR